MASDTDSIHQRIIVDNSKCVTVSHLPGSRDDAPGGVDLPLVDLVAQTPVEESPRFRDWPDLHTRLQWAHEISLTLDLSALERAVLKHVCWRAGKRDDGRGPGCWESAANIGIAIDYHRNQVGRALATLVDLGLLEAARRYGKPTIHRPTLRPADGLQMHEKRASDCTKNVQRNKKDNGKVFTQGKLSNWYEDKGGDSVAEDSESCGFDGCPPVGRVCPMCGRQGGGNHG